MTEPTWLLRLLVNPDDEYSLETPAEPYAEAENRLDIAVRNPLTRGSGRERFTDYEVVCDTNIPAFKYPRSAVRRRYSDFVWLRTHLIREFGAMDLPPLPPKSFSQRFSETVVEERRQAFERFLRSAASHPFLYRHSRALGPFLQDPNFVRDESQ